jgi:hypothetical protein
MSFEPIDQVIERIMNLYNENPRGWNVLIDRKGNILVLGPRTGYKLHLISINPQEYTGVGVKIQGLEEIREALKSTPSYGFRPLTRHRMKRLLNSIKQDGLIKEELIRELFRVKPIPTGELQGRTEAILSGPIITHPDLSAVSKGQRELEARLTVEAEKLFRMKYPSRARIYS